MSERPLRLSLTDQQRFDWLRLFRTETIGPRTFRALLNRFGSARAALEALPDLARERGRPIVIAAEREIEAELTAMRRIGGHFVALGEADYPAPLEAIDSAPPLVAMRGIAAILARPMVAIVGARNASALGRRFAAQLARGLGEAGIVVVSGLARGIDGAAHEATLGTGTAAVLAGGLGRVYPREHEPLADKIAETGCILSEMPFEWVATGRDFPRRNRIVSGLAYGVVVVEAALRSGSLITARFANEQGREVFAVPGSPLDPRSAGANRLIRQGATLITGVGDILESLQPMIAAGEPSAPPLREGEKPDDEPLWDEWPELAQIAPTAPPQQASNEHAGRERLVSLLGRVPISIDEARSSGLALSEVQLAVLELDLAGRIERHGDNRISLA
jgi:DNA processing protein